ncbi:MAG: hypothetical protein NTY33_01840 [Candidatus Moranbacteria bacterium]|nr:hypothetical protein [Candidatus Moranbacteria bacterium]
MQKKKYLFSLVVLAVSLIGIFGGKMEARAANTTCWCGDRTGENEIVQVGTSVNLVNDDACNQECANRNASIYCYNVPCVLYSNVTKMPNPIPGTIKCCVNSAAGLCDDKPTNNSCPAGVVPQTQSCTEIPTCPQYKAPVTPAPTPDPGTPTTTTFINPITSNSIDDVLTSLLTALSGLVVTLAIIFIVLGGILYMMSAGDPGMIKRAKDCWLFSVIGLSIVIAAPTFLKEVQTILGGNLTDKSGKVAAAASISQIATNVLNFLLSITGIIAIISLVIAGGMYMTSYGDDTRIGTAKKIGTYAIIGIVVALVSLIAVQQVSKLITG